MYRLIISLIINAISLGAAAYVVSGVNFAPTSSIFTVLMVALIFGLVNTLVRPLLAFVTCPFYIITLGLFTFVVNAFMLMLTSWLAGSAFDVSGFWSALFASIIISLVSTILSLFLKPSDEDEGEEDVVVIHHRD